MPKLPFLSKLVKAIRREISSTLFGFILAAVAVAVGLQVPQSGQETVKYAALAPAENLPSQVANPISFIMPALTGLILALTIYLVAKRNR